MAEQEAYRADSITLRDKPILLTVAEIASNLQIFSTLAEEGVAPRTAAGLAAVKAADVTLTSKSTLGIRRSPVPKQGKCHRSLPAPH